MNTKTKKAKPARAARPVVFANGVSVEFRKHSLWVDVRLDVLENGLVSEDREAVGWRAIRVPLDDNLAGLATMIAKLTAFYNQQVEEMNAGVTAVPVVLAKHVPDTGG